MNLSREQILRASIFKGCDVLEGVVLKVNLIPLEMNLISFRIYDVFVILDMDWLSTYRTSMDYLPRGLYFRNQDI